MVESRSRSSRALWNVQTGSVGSFHFCLIKSLMKLVGSGRSSWYSIEQNGYVVEQSHSKGQIIVRRFDLESLRQFMSNVDP